MNRETTPGSIRGESGPIPFEQFTTLLPAICDRQASKDPKGWSEENPLWSCCGVVSLMAQKLYGGKILRASLAGTAYEKGKFHFINEFPWGREDLTVDQFALGYPEGLKFEEYRRLRMFRSPDVRQRYTLLTLRLTEKLRGENPLFADPLYLRTMQMALSSPCQKGGFGALVVEKGEVVAEGNNTTIDDLRFLCDPACIRLSIASRQDPMIGACGHAEEWAMVKARKAGVYLAACDLYVAGVDRHGLPWIKKQADHTCLRCSVAMHYAEIRRVFVPVEDRWASLTTSEALRTAVAYATGEKKI